MFRDMVLLRRECHLPKPANSQTVAYFGLQALNPDLSIRSAGKKTPGRAHGQKNVPAGLKITIRVNPIAEPASPAR